MATTSAKKIRLALYARVGKDLLDRIRRDSKKSKKSLDSLTSAILMNHFTMKYKDREKLYLIIPNKSSGRPIS